MHAETAILTLFGGFHPQMQSLCLIDMAYHHLVIAVLFLIAGHMYIISFGIGQSIKNVLEAHVPMRGVHSLSIKKIQIKYKVIVNLQLFILLIY
jgi:hypothetical protein